MLLDNNKLHELEIFKHVESSSRLNNRAAAVKIGGSVRLAHDLLKRMVTSGWLRIHKVNSRRWDYYITDKGSQRKNELLADMWQFSLDFYHQVREVGVRLAGQLVEKSFRRIALIGAGEAAELVYLGLRERGLEVLAVFSDTRIRFPGVTVRPIREVAQPLAVDVFIYCGEGEELFYPQKNLSAELVLPPETYTILGEKMRPGVSVLTMPEMNERIKKIINDIGGVLQRNVKNPFELYWLDSALNSKCRIDLRVKSRDRINLEAIKEKISDINFLYLIDLVKLEQIDDEEYEQVRMNAKRLL